MSAWTWLSSTVLYASMNCRRACLGRSEGLFDGIFLVTDSGPQLAGDVALASQNLREFARWAWPEGSDWIAAHWTGSRGRLKLQTRIDLLNDKYRATEASFEIDDTHHTGSLTITGGSEPHTDLVLNSDLLDLDSFVSGGLLGGTGMAVIRGFSETASAAKKAAWPRLSLSLTADRLRLNGTDAHDTRIEIEFLRQEPRSQAGRDRPRRRCEARYFRIDQRHGRRPQRARHDPYDRQ